MKTTIIRLLLFLYLTSSYLGATHFHHDALESVDCKVHILVKNLNSGDTPTNTLELISCEGCFNAILFNESYFIFALNKGFNANAPPHS